MSIRRNYFVANSYYVPSARMLRFITKVHRGLYRATAGVLGATLPEFGQPGAGFLVRAMPILLLTTTGRKSGIKHTVPLPYVTYDGRRFVVASNAGGPQHAAWYLNLLDDPRVTVQVGRVRAQQRAVDLSAEARARIWSRLIVDSPRYGVYQAGTARVIPLVELVAEA